MATEIQKISVNDKVRSFDFAGRDLEGERACYIEGTVVAMGEVIEGCARYEIMVERQVFGGKELTGEHSLVGHPVYPPLNGTPTWGDEVTGCVYRIEPVNCNGWTWSEWVNDAGHAGYEEPKKNSAIRAQLVKAWENGDNAAAWADEE